MHRPDEQATLDTAMGWLGVGMIVLMLVLTPIALLVPIPIVRIAIGAILALVGLFAWVSMWAVRSE
jgi:hypothetical protein